MAMPLQHNISRPRLTAKELMSRAEGQSAPFGASSRRPVQVPATISASRNAAASTETATVRVMIQWRASGRARIRSMKPLSISAVGIVAREVAMATSDPIIARWK
jgi:hypothetical protein